MPHADPMILLSGYEPQTARGKVESWVEVSERSPFYEAEIGGVPGCVALEYMAQTMALLTGLERRRDNLPPKMGFVLGSRRLEVLVPCFKKGAKYRIKAESTYQDESFGSFDCTISDESGAVVASALVTAFQPEDGATPEKLGELK